jgi:hypothetical protein
MSYRILVGLPSFNEADTIATVARDIDRGIATLPFPADAVIVNADNSSTDGTLDVFLAAPTTSPKSAIATPYAAGKGTNWRALLEHAANESVDAVLFVDSDLAAVPESWVHTLLGHIREGADFCFPRRPPTWNGGDLTYHLAYPAIAGVFGADLAEPLCGDLALSQAAVRLLLDQDWTEVEHRFGVDFLLATCAVTTHWDVAALAARRRNKLRSFSTGPDGEYRMGAKFAEVATAVAYRARQRLAHPSPETFTPTPAPAGDGRIVPDRDPDIAALAISTARQLRTDLNSGALSALPTPLAGRIEQHVRNGADQGLDWPTWRACLFHWIRQTPGADAISVDLFETLFLNRVVGHHREIAGTANWYNTVHNQAQDAFTHRHTLWATA